MLCRVAIGYILLLGTVITARSQTDLALLSMSYGSHAQTSYSIKAEKLYSGRYTAARNEYLSFILRLAPSDGVLDNKDISQLKDKRPRYIKLLEKVDMSKMNEATLLDFTSNLNAMGIYYHARGELRIADFLFVKCLKIRGEKFGKTSGSYVETLHNIANLRKDQGRFDAAEDIFKYVLEYYENVNGEKSQEYCISLNNKAMLDASLGRTKAATDELDNAIKLHAQLNIPGQSIDGERMQVNRALLAMEAGDIVLTQTLLMSAKEGFERKGFEDHPDYNDLIIYLGTLYMLEGGASSFEPLLDKAFKKTEATYGKTHLFYANIIELQSEFFLKNEDYQKAQPLLQEIVAIRLSKLSDRHPQYLSALAKLAMVESKLGNTGKALVDFMKVNNTFLELTTLFFTNMSEMEQARFWLTFQFSINLFYEFAVAHPRQTGMAEAVLDLQLNTKGMLLNNCRRIRESILNSENTSLKLKFGQWQIAKEELSGYYALSKEDLEFEEIDLQKYESDVNQMEQELVRESNVFSSGLTKRPINWKEIQKQLNEKEFALEIVRAEGTYGASRKIPFYFSVIVDSQGLPQLLNLNDGRELEGRYFQYYKNTIQNRMDDAVSYQKYWGPLATTLAPASRIYVSPDGIYNNISLMTLKQGSRFLLDEKEIVIIPSLKSLIRDNSKSNASPRESLLLGNPAYGNSERLAQLPGTEKEVKEIYQVLSDASREVRVLRGDSATESALKAEVSPEILHVATHGYFLDDVSPSASSRSVMGVQISNAREHPLLRSGLMLAGGAQAMDSELLFERKDNGILTAFEALNMNLEGTHLVVLSACETGLGKIVNGEGVYGLSRSFLVAGSRAVIISLWKVDDQSTQLLMSAFYKIWLQTSELESSFVQAQKVVKETYPDPYHWGAFVLYSN